jgi:CubicO group peptidase (beta-lactamase class C family)
MQNSLAFEKDINQVPDRSFGYNLNKDGSVEFADQSLTSAVLGDGGIYSNLQDMYLWDQVLYSDKLLGKELLQKAMSRQQLNNGEWIDYGFGWHLESYRGMDIVYHTGSTRGFRNVLYRIPQRNFSVVVLTNRDGFGTLNSIELGRRITDLFLLEKSEND